MRAEQTLAQPAGPHNVRIALKKCYGLLKDQKRRTVVVVKGNHFGVTILQESTYILRSTVAEPNPDCLWRVSQ
jgi:hypothetical protein